MIKTKRKKLYKLMAKRGHAILLNHTLDGRIKSQFISDGYAVYPLENTPILNEESVCCLLRMDWWEATAETLSDPDFLRIILPESDPSDTPLEIFGREIFEHVCVFTHHKHEGDGLPEELYLLDPKYFKVLKDERNLKIFSRACPAVERGRVILLRDENSLRAAIMPLKFSRKSCESAIAVMNKAIAELEKELERNDQQ